MRVRSRVSENTLNTQALDAFRVWSFHSQLLSSAAENEISRAHVWFMVNSSTLP